MKFLILGLILLSGCASAPTNQITAEEKEECHQRCYPGLPSIEDGVCLCELAGKDGWMGYPIKRKH